MPAAVDDVVEQLQLQLHSPQHGALASSLSWGFEPWAFENWYLGNSQKELETLTLALQQELYSSSSPQSCAAASAKASEDPSSEQGTAASKSGSAKRSGSLGVGNGNGARVNKRRSRASSRAPITVLNADPANFRAMVQEVTGIPLNPHLTASGKVWPSNAVQTAVKKPPGSRNTGSAGGAGTNGVIQGLPTLDTSAILMEQIQARQEHRAGVENAESRSNSIQVNESVASFPPPSLSASSSSSCASDLASSSRSVETTWFDADALLLEALASSVNGI